MYTRGIKKGEDYDKLEKAIVILITDKKIKDIEDIDRTIDNIVEKFSKADNNLSPFTIYLLSIIAISENNQTIFGRLLQFTITENMKA